MKHFVLLTFHNYNESTASADASVEALKLYHMKLSYSIDMVAVAYLLC